MTNERKEIIEYQYRSTMESQIKLFIGKHFWEPIKEYQTINNWLSQFPEESLAPYFLMDALIVFTKEQVAVSLGNILEQVRTSIYQEHPNWSDHDLFVTYKEHLAQSVFICACTQGQMASGAPETMRAFRDIAVEGPFQEVSAAKLCHTILGNNIKYVYIVDDFIGTGTTMATQLNCAHSHDDCPCGATCPHCTLKCAADHHPGVQFTVVSVVMHEKGKCRLEDEFKQFKLMTAYQIDDTYDLLSKECILYRDPNYIEEIISEVHMLMKKYQMKENQFAQHLPLAISGKFPNNSLQLFWWSQSPDWKPLIPRRH